jgi:hypothetical protein
MILLYQKQRRRDDLGRFVADYLDYFLVYQLLEESFAESLGSAYRYTDDRIVLIEKEGMMTPRHLAERTGVTTAAISQWLKVKIDNGVLTWCDETGALFDNDLALEKAKRGEKAYLCVAGGKSLPSPFQLTGNPRWDKGGDLYEAFDLGLNDPGALEGCSYKETENIISDGDVDADFVPDKGIDKTADKVLSTKSNDEIKKILESFREIQSGGGNENLKADELFQEFNEILQGPKETVQ